MKNQITMATEESKIIDFFKKCMEEKRVMLWDYQDMGVLPMPINLWEIVSPNDEDLEYDDDEFPNNEPMLVYKASPNSMAKYWVSYTYVKKNLVASMCECCKDWIGIDLDTEWKKDYAGKFNYEN